MVLKITIHIKLKIIDWIIHEKEEASFVILRGIV
jgi:hypothetical protein